MCGIAGVIAFDGNFEVTDPYLVCMRDTMVHRGPDGGGTWISADRRVGLAHRRLSIIDLSAAADQPMQDVEGRWQVVFNGEIYNHVEIRRELEATGRYVWRTDHSDTEVILHAFAEWGPSALERFRGMFALAIWDARARELWLVRDRMGIKPLYYSIHHGRLTFASEIKALLTDPQQERAVNEESFFHYLSFLASPSPETLFRGIKKLPNGCLLRVALDGTVTEQRWYDLAERVKPLENVSEPELCDRVMAELREAVRLRKVSDVPVGVFLSGGVDSTTNVALFSEGESGDVNSFSIGYDAEYASYRNELDWAARAAKVYGTKHHERRLTVDDLIDFLPEMVRLQDEPIADPVCVPLYFVSKLARDAGVIVCQAGEGADELFMGYENWRRKWRLQRVADGPVPAVAKRALLAGMRGLGLGASKSAEALRRDVAGQPIFWGTTEAFTHAEKLALLSPRLRARFRVRSSWEAIEPVYDRFRAGGIEQSWMNWMGYVDLNTRLPELLLMRLDKMTMGVSLEGRVPFLDHKFVELALSIPERQKIGDGSLKYLLKRAVRGTTPDWVIDRPKQGFGVPVFEWFLGRLGDQAREVVGGFCAETDFFDPEEVARMFAARDPRLWYVYNFAMWWNQYR